MVETRSLEECQRTQWMWKQCMMSFKRWRRNIEVTTRKSSDNENLTWWLAMVILMPMMIWCDSSDDTEWKIMKCGCENNQESANKIKNWMSHDDFSDKKMTPKWGSMAMECKWIEIEINNNDNDKWNWMTVQERMNMTRNIEWMSMNQSVMKGWNLKSKKNIKKKWMES